MNKQRKRLFLLLVIFAVVGVYWVSKIGQLSIYNILLSTDGLQKTSWEQQANISINYALNNDLTWQRLTEGNDEIFIYNIYMDTRNKADVKLRTFVISKGYLSAPVYYLLWYDNGTISVLLRASIERIEISTYYVERVHYSQYMVSCSVSPKWKHPKYASLLLTNNTNKIETYFKIVLPDISTNTSVLKQIGVCLAAQYGRVSDNDTPLLVQWMESLKLFGVGHVTMFNASMVDIGKYRIYTKVLKYYIQEGLLTLKQLRPPYESVQSFPAERIDHNTAETLRMIATNDCLYRNLLRYDFILHIDRDEIVVPKAYDSYHSFLSAFLKQTPKHKLLASISIRSAFFYTYFNNSVNKTDHNSSYTSKTFSTKNNNVNFLGLTDLYPTNHFKHRTPIEEIQNGPGFSKSFINTKYCLNIWSHRCTKGKAAYAFVNPDDILVHHYRSSCRMGKRCKDEQTRMNLDDTFPTLYGQVINSRTKEVFAIIGRDQSVGL